jgi:hypothetical protein
MRIELNPESMLVKHRPCWLNPRVKEKVKMKIDRMLTAGMIFIVDKAEWMSHIVIHTNKGMDDI